MKRIGRTGVLFCMMAVLLAGTALANSAPPDYLLVVRLVNAPEEPYYLDILEKEDGRSNRSISHQSDEASSALGEDFLDGLRNEIPEGWKACTMENSSSLFPCICQGMPVSTGSAVWTRRRNSASSL